MMGRGLFPGPFPAVAPGQQLSREQEIAELESYLSVCEQELKSVKDRLKQLRGSKK